MNKLVFTILKARAGLVKKKVEVKGKGRTYQAYRYVAPEHKARAKAKAKEHFEAAVKKPAAKTQTVDWDSVPQSVQRKVGPLERSLEMDRSFMSAEAAKGIQDRIDKLLKPYTKVEGEEKQPKKEMSDSKYKKMLASTKTKNPDVDGKRGKLTGKLVDYKIGDATRSVDVSKVDEELLDELDDKQLNAIAKQLKANPQGPSKQDMQRAVLDAVAKIKGGDKKPSKLAVAVAKKRAAKK